MKEGLITKIQRFSVHDGPGIRTTIFFNGCPLECKWCQNPENISGENEILFISSRCIGCKRCLEICPNECFIWKKRNEFNSENCNKCGLCRDNCKSKALQWSSKKISDDLVIKEILRDKLYYDLSNGGVTLSGGEPLKQFDYVYGLIKKLKKEGINIAIDTSGFIPTKNLKKIIAFTDLFLYDLKFINEELHKKYTGKSNKIILRNFKILVDAKANIEIRVPIIEKINNTKKNLKEIEDFVREQSMNIKIKHIPFNKLCKEKYLMVGKKLGI